MWWRKRSGARAAARGVPLAAAVLLLGGGLAAGGEGWETQPYGVSGRMLPWEQPGYRGYQEATRPGQSAPAVVTAAPQKYVVLVERLPHRPQGVAPNVGVVMAHLPEDAQVSFNGRPTRSQGRVRYFESPPLEPGKHYYYTARVVWHENGKWVSKTRRVPVRAGEMHCLYLTTSGEKGKIAANLARLSPDDRKLAEAQKFCPVDEIPLGLTGVPVKVMVKDRPVFLCSPECVDQALAQPDRTLARLKDLRDRTAEAPGK